MTPLNRKLVRDLLGMKGQVIAIAMVIGAGIALYVAMASALTSLEGTRQAYYSRYRFADVFASLVRAPLWLADEIARIPGVSQVQPRVVVEVNLDVADFPDPVAGRLISIPADRRPALNDLFISEGRYIEPNQPDEVMVAENFANAHELGPGDTLAAVINGRRRELRIVGLALTPEYVYSIRPGEILPDDARFAVLWMERRALAAAYQMEGGFNDIVLKLRPDASEDDVIAQLDRLLEPYGGLGAIPRSLQVSHWYLESELAGLRSFGAVLPLMFLCVAAFLLNVSLARVVTLQREQIAMIKAIGYTNRDVALHYVGLGMVISVLGAIIGIAGGMEVGRGMTELYAEFYHFPILLYELASATALYAVLIALGAAVLGALTAVRRAVSLPPAEAMRPEPPASYHESLVERIGLKRFLSQSSRIVVRSISRHPFRSAISVTGISFGAALVILGFFSDDAFTEMLDTQFFYAQRYDVMVTFSQPASGRAFYEVQRMEGVTYAEPVRSIPVRFRHGHRFRNSAITGLPPESRLNRIVDVDNRVHSVPPDGLVMSQVLARALDVSAGDVVMAEVLVGRRPTRQVLVARLVDDYMGANAYMNIGALHDLMQEGETLSGAVLQVNADSVGPLYEQLKETPGVAGVVLKGAAIQSFEETIAASMGAAQVMYAVFAAIIAIGVVYNGARVALSERSRELATLRVIGFTRGEITSVLLGELAVLTGIAIPVGMLLGYGGVWALVRAFTTEAFRIPLIIYPRTYAISAIVIVVSTALSGLIIRRKLNRLDLVSTLKTRE